LIACVDYTRKEALYARIVGPNSLEDRMSWKKTGQAGAAGATGAAAGYAATRIAGMSAAAMVGRCAGIGCSAGPVGVAIGALAGLAIYGLVEAILDEDTED
jgi:phage tail tape-measure protein